MFWSADHFFGPRILDSVSLHKRERRVTYQFGKGYRLGRKEQEIAKLKDSLDISPIPDWIEGTDYRNKVYIRE